MAEPRVPTQGTLEEHPLSAVLRSLLRAGKDGCLSVSRGAITRRLYLRRGMIVYASSNEPSDRLGEILIVQGKLSRADHKRYWEQSQAGNQLLGITLVLNGRITLQDLYQGVTAQVVTILDRVQKWRKGDYSFEGGAGPKAGTVLLSIPLALYLKADPEKKRPRRAPTKGKAAARAAAPAAEPPAAAPPDPGEPVIEVVDEVVGGEPAAPSYTPDAAADLARLGEVSFMVQELRKRVGQEPHALLGVPADAARATVQAAYHRIAKVLHVDRLPALCPPELAQEAEDILREVTAASQATGEGKKPAAAQAAPAQHHRQHQISAEDEQARRFFAQGREWISKRNYWQAADALRQAVRLQPEEPVYRQYLGLALMQTRRLHEAEEHFVVASRLEPSSAAHWVNLGRVYRGGRLYKKAREAFERALRLDSRNAQAREELADLPEEPVPGKKGDSGGILKKLFGK